MNFNDLYKLSWVSNDFYRILFPIIDDDIIEMHSTIRSIDLNLKLSWLYN